MIDCMIDYEYIEGPAKEHMRVTGEPMPSGWAMMWCMTAASFYRIFTKEDMKEFLFRLVITLHSMDLVENWMLKDRLMPCIVLLDVNVKDAITRAVMYRENKSIIQCVIFRQDDKFNVKEYELVRYDSRFNEQMN